MVYLDSEVALPHTLNAVTKCWQLAEKALRLEINRFAPDKDETEIIASFHQHFARQLDDWSNRKLFQKEFLSDVYNSLPFDFTCNAGAAQDLEGFARGIVASVTLHDPRKTEGKTGGDFGLLLVQPKVTLSIEEDSHLFSVPIIVKRRRGLLCQAKLKNAKGQWGTFTKPQKKSLPDRLEYLALPLYSYRDAERHKLRPFSWKVCKELTFDEITRQLKQNGLKGCVTSRKVLLGLGNSTIGTGDDKTIDDIIAPSSNKSLILTIWWKNGQPKFVSRTLGRTETLEEDKVFEMYGG